MQRLYKFFFLLFLMLFVISFLYGTLASWGFFKLLQLSARDGVKIGEVPFSTYAKLGLIQAVTYSLVQFTSIVFLLRLSFHQGKKFTLNNMIQYHLWFLVLTTALFLLYVTWYALSLDFSIIVLMLGPQFSLPGPLWLPFLIAWLVLYIFLAQKIKRQAAYGRKD